MTTPQPQLVEGFLKDLLGARKALRLYPASNPLAVQWLQRLHQTIGKALAEGLPTRLRVSQLGFEWDGGQLPTRDQLLEAFRFELVTRKITEISITTGVEVWELQKFLDLLNEAAPAADAEAALPPDRQRMVHIALGGSLSRYTQPEAVAPSAANLDALEQAVTEILEALVELVRDLTYDRGRLAEWFTTLWEVDERGEALLQAIQMLIPLVDVEPDRDVRCRTLAESLLALPDAARGTMIVGCLIPAMRTDLNLINLLTRFSADEFAELLAVLPAEMLNTFRAEVEALPIEEWKKARLSESLEDLQAEKEVAAVPVEPLIADDDPELLKIRDAAAAAGTPERVLQHSVKVLFYLVGETESAAYPVLLVDALEEAIGEALGRDQLPLALGILRWLRQPEGLRPEWTAEHQRRLTVLERRLAGRTQVSPLVDALRRGDGQANVSAGAEYLGALGAEAIEEFTGIVVDEEDASARDRLLEILGTLGPMAAPALRARVSDRRWPIARSMIALLTRIGDMASVPAIEKAAGHEHAQVRCEVARALPVLAGKHGVRGLLGYLADPDAEVRRTAQRGLHTLARAGAVAPIRDYLATPTRAGSAVLVKRELIRVLASIGDPQARQGLESIARRRIWPWQWNDRKVRGLARQALQGAGEGLPGS